MPPNQRKQSKQQPASQKVKQELGLLRFKADGSQVTLQHHVVTSTCDNNGAAKPQAVLTLRIDLKSGKIWVGTAGALPEDSPLTLGIIGLLRLERGSILALISKAKRVCALLDGPVYKVEDTTLVAPEAINACENDLRHASLFQEAFNPKCFGSHLYFSHTANITASRQRQADMSPGLPEALPMTHTIATAATAHTDNGNSNNAIPTLGVWWCVDSGEATGKQRGPAVAAARPRGGLGRGGSGCGTLWSRSDSRFVWNRELMRPLIDAGAESFALPLMNGYIGQATGATFILRPPPPNRPAHPNGLGQEGANGLGGCMEPAADGGGNGDILHGGQQQHRDRSSSAGQHHQQQQQQQQQHSVQVRSPSSDVCRSGVENGGDAHCPGELTLISRLGVERPVAGPWRRGADRHGHTAGFTETEVVLTLWAPGESGEVPQGVPSGGLGAQLHPPGKGVKQPAVTQGGSEDLKGQEGRMRGEHEATAKGRQAPEGGSAAGRRDDGGGEAGAGAGTAPLRRLTRVAVASYAMVRGSLPLYCSAPPDMSPCPAPRGPEEAAAHTSPFRKHVDALIQVYGKPLLLLNLICGFNHRAQLRLHDTLQKQLALYETSSSAPSASPAGAATTPSAGPAESESDRLREPSVAPGGAAGGVAVVGMLLDGADVAQLASGGAAAARLEEQCRPETRCMGAFLSVEELEMTHAEDVGTGTPATAAAAPTGTDVGSGGDGGGCLRGGSGGRACVALTGRSVLCRQRGVVRVSSGSTGSAGGCCEEVDLVQYALALPALAEALVAVGAMQDVADMERVHASVMLALSQLWSNMADVLADQALGTDSSAGRLLRSAAAGMEQLGSGVSGLLAGAVRNPWRTIVTMGDALSRYYYSNFSDARRQDALDLACGAYKVSQPPALMPRRQPPSTTSLQLGLLLLAIAIIQVVLCAVGAGVTFGDLGVRAGAPATIGVILLYDILRRGATYVEQPVALPESVYAWSD